MNKIVLISSVAFLMSCAVCKERRAEKKAAKAQVTEVKEESQVSERPMREEDMMGIVGTVRVNQDACPVLIEVTNGDLFLTLYPVNLEKQYQVEGLKLKFNYNPSKAPSPESCVVDMVASLSDIEIIK